MHVPESSEVNGRWTNDVVVGQVKENDDGARRRREDSRSMENVGVAVHVSLKV